MIDRGLLGVSILMCGLLLAALGSLRDVVTPLGYWALWACWAVVAWVNAWPQSLLGLRRDLPPNWVGGSFGLLILGMLFSAWASYSGITVYQALKIAAIAACSLAAWRLAAVVSWPRRVAALQGALAVTVLAFMASKAWPQGHYLHMGIAGREGSFLAWPGVIWKAGAFFMPLMLANVVMRPDRWLPNGLAVAAGVFLILIDGSRTGLLVLVAIFIAFGAFVAWRREAAMLVRSRRTLITAVLALPALLFVNLGIGIYAGLAPAAAAATTTATANIASAQTDRGNVARGGAGSAGHGAASNADGAGSLIANPAAVIAKAETFVDAAVDPVTTTRLGNGDPQRMTLLRHGVARSWDCFPLGCGFGSTAIDAGYGIPMQVHNAYIATLADFGVLGLLGMLGFIAAAIVPILRVTRPNTGSSTETTYFVVASGGAALAYLATLMLHTFSSEMSEWGYLLVMLAFAWCPLGAAHADAIPDRVGA